MQRRRKDEKKNKLQLLCAAAKQQHSQARLCDPLTSHSLKKNSLDNFQYSQKNFWKLLVKS